MKLISLSLLLTTRALFAADLPKSDPAAIKAEIREAQVQEAPAKAAQASAHEKEAAALAEYYRLHIVSQEADQKATQASTATTKVIEESGKKLGCVIDPATAECLKVPSK